MRVLAFIRQRSFARFVAFDLAEAARQQGWDVTWLDLDGERQALAALSGPGLASAAAALRQRIATIAPDLTVAYGLEAFAPVVGDLLPGEQWTVADLVDSPIAAFLFDFGYPFDAPADPAAAALLDRLRAPDIGLWCWDAAAIDDMARLRIPAAPFPMAVNDRMFFPPVADARDLPVVFAGGPTAERRDALAPLLPHGLTVYGYDAEGWGASPGLRAAHRGLVDARPAMRALYQRARLAVNVTRAHGRDSLNMRVFEAMACGCLVVTDQASAAATLFEPGRHLVTYTSPGQLEALVAHYLAHEDQRRRIADAGARLVAARHTYAVRLAGIADALRALVVEGRAWRQFLRFHATDPAKAARFVAALRHQGIVRRHDAWPA